MTYVLQAPEIEKVTEFLDSAEIVSVEYSQRPEVDSREIPEDQNWTQLLEELEDGTIYRAEYSASDLNQDQEEISEEYAVWFNLDLHYQEEPSDVADIEGVTEDPDNYKFTFKGLHGMDETFDSLP